MVETLYNWGLTGASLNASVIAVSNDTVKVAVDVDGGQEESKAKWFPYSTVYSSPDGTGWYCMPEKGDHVRLYFPDEIEDDGYIISSIHTGNTGAASGANAPRSNPDNKSISNKYNKQIQLTPTTIVMTNNNGMSITLDDEEGISIVSDKKISIQSEDEIDILSTNAAINVNAEEQIVLSQNSSKITMKDSITIEKFFMEIVPNQHAKAYLVGMATDFGAYDQWKNTKEDMLVKVYTGENILFAGYVKTAECCFENRIHHIILELVSTTEGMDRVRKSKSFQDVSASYKEIIEDCVSEEQAGFEASFLMGTNALTVSTIPDIVTAGGMTLLATDGAYVLNEINTMCTGQNLAVDTVFEGNSYDINKLQKTQPYTYPENVDSIKQTIAQNGPNAVPPIEIRVDNGQVLVVDGHHRLEAFRQLGYDRVPIKYLHSSQLGKVLSDGTYYRSLEELLTAAKLSN